MSLPVCTVNTNNIQNLPDSPTLAPDELKQEFDKSGKDLKDYLNDILLPAVEKLVRDEKANLEASINSKILADNKKRYHIGKIVMSTSNTNPSQYLGFGTWVLWGQGRVPVGVDANDSNFNAVEKTGGSNVHSHNSGKTGTPSTNTSGSTVLTIAQMPSHRHVFHNGSKATAPVAMRDGGNHEVLQGNGGRTYEYLGMSDTGGGQGHTHTLSNHTHTISDGSSLQKYITCYMWKRTA